jgi:hypothetical protein
MPLELAEIGISAGVGIIDNVLVELEERGTITGDLKYIKDGIRIVGALGGLAVNAFIAAPRSTLDTVSGALALSELPLAMHSIRKLVKGASASYGGGWTLEHVGSPQTQVPVSIPQSRTPAVITSY